MQRLRERFSFTDRLVHLPAMIEVVCQCRVNIGQAEVIFGQDLIGAPAHALVTDRDVLDLDPTASYTGFAARDAGCDLDVVV